MTKEEIKQRNEIKKFLRDLQRYLFQNKRSPKIDELFVLLDNDEKRIAELEAKIEKMKTRIKEIIFSNDFVNNSPHQNLEKKVRALYDFYKEIKENA